MKRALLVIDMQIDFISGLLPVPGAQEAVENVCKLLEKEKFDQIYATQDYHFPGNIAFANAWNGAKEGDVITLEDLESGKVTPRYVSIDRAKKYLEKVEKQVLWPIHCLAGSIGSSIPEDLLKAFGDDPWILHQKGIFLDTEMYSAFSTADDSWQDWDFLQELSGYDEVWIVGLAKDYCVASSIQDIMGTLKEKLVIYEPGMACIDPANPTLEVYKEASELYGARRIL